MIPLLGSPDSYTAFDDSDSAIDLLADRRRRELLQYLESVGGSALLAEAAVEIATRETTSVPNAISDHGDVSSRDRRAARISLHHAHVPKLAAAGAVEFESETETVRLTDRGRTLLSRAKAVCDAPR
ncbi:DUF7344 domain-containing protein [Natrinema marinum]|uniref:DUF7344 domain-containing protein n=1 Tax=Natrinema marinum TaxID=2961598 RepID=UPI0020C869E7|nr:hypothetical protein [Natrinema marinum]